MLNETAKDYLTLAALVVTSITAAFIAWQALETRRTGQIALRSQLDATAPRLFVWFAPPDWPPYRASSSDVTALHGPQLTDQERWDPATTERDTRIVLLVHGMIQNEGERRVTVNFLHPCRPDEPDENGRQNLLLATAKSTTRILRPGQSRQLLLPVQRTVAEWAGGEAWTTTVITAADVYDTGVTESWSLTVTGSPLTQHGSLLRLAPQSVDGSPVVTAALSPVKRDYWLSKQRRKHL